MPLAFHKIAVLLLLPAFLLINVGEAFASVWCIGNDGHVKVELTVSNSCGDPDIEEGNSVGHNVPTMFQSGDDHCGPCLDFSAQQSSTVFFKRFKVPPTVSIDAITPNIFPRSSVHTVKLVVDNLMPQPPSRTSQTILALRTVVLLN